MKTNLGTINTDIKMNIPGFNSNTAVYSGMVTASDLQVGILLEQPLFGAITFKEKISGNSFNPDKVQMNIDGFIQQFTIKDYPYQNIAKALLRRNNSPVNYWSMTPTSHWNSTAALIMQTPM